MRSNKTLLIAFVIVTVNTVITFHVVFNKSESIFESKSDKNVGSQKNSQKKSPTLWSADSVNNDDSVLNFHDYEIQLTEPNLENPVLLKPQQNFQNLKSIVHQGLLDLPEKLPGKHSLHEKQVFKHKKKLQDDLMKYQLLKMRTARRKHKHQCVNLLHNGHWNKVERGGRLPGMLPEYKVVSKMFDAKTPKSQKFVQIFDCQERKHG